MLLPQRKTTAYCYDRKGKLLSTGTNSYTKTHPIQQYFANKAGLPHKVFLHAEIQAILRAKDATIHKIRVVRYGANGLTANAKPCPICMLAIAAYGIKEIEYTTSSGIQCLMMPTS